MGEQLKPNRLHHNAYVTKDLEKTRAFYEDVIGMPLVATWCEVEDLFGKERVFAHCFFEMHDGSALAFFQFADESDHAEFGPEQAPSPFIHLALHVDDDYQAQIEARAEKLDLPEGDYYVLDHGYCRSVYLRDPNGLLLEFTNDVANAADIAKQRQADAHSELKRWLAGDHTSNNEYR